MSVGLAVLVLFIITIALVVFPILPSLIEWRKRTDIEPLRVVYESEVDIRHFARGFRAFIDTNFSEALEECRRTRETREGELENGTRYLVMGNGNLPMPAESASDDPSTGRVILSCSDLELPSESAYLTEIYSGGSVRGGERNVYRALLAEGKIQLGQGSRSLRWLHGEQEVHAEKACALHGRVSSEEAVTLEENCGFERLHAPTIEFACSDKYGRPSESSEPAEPDVVLASDDVPNVLEDAAGRWLIANKLDLPANSRVESSLVVSGRARIGEGCRIVGSIKSHDDLFIEQGVVVEGSVVSGRDLHIGPGCRITGPVLAEKEALIEAGTVIGSTEALTTVSARKIQIACGTVAHGTVWAHVGGLVTPVLQPAGSETTV